MMESYIESGKLASKIRGEASKMIKDGTLVIDLVEYVESEILEAGADIAFPCNVSLSYAPFLSRFYHYTLLL